MSSQQLEQLHRLFFFFFFYGSPSAVPITKIITAQAVTPGTPAEAAGMGTLRSKEHQPL